MQSDNPSNVLLQLQDVYSNLQTTKEENSTLNSPSFQSLDYGEKLIVNHNILKDLITIVDKKIAARQIKRAMTFGSSQSKVELKGQKSNIPEKKQQKYQNESGLHEKMLVVRQKLKEIISYINSQPRISMKIKLNQPDLQQIKQISSHYEPSLQYSRDPSELMEISKERYINMDKSKFEQAKEVESRQVLYPFNTNRSDKSQRSQIDHNFMKSSLEKISEVQSGQNVTEKEVSRGHSRNNSRDTNNISMKIPLQSEDLDDTGKIILSTINKKTVSTTTIHKNKKGSLPPSLPSEQSSIMKEVPSSQERDSVQNSVKKNKFWLKNEKKSIQAYTKGTVVSSEEFQELKSPQKCHQFKHFPQNKAEQNLQLNKRSIQKIEAISYRSPSKIVQNSAIEEVQSNQMIPFSYNPSVITHHSQLTNNSSFLQEPVRSQPVHMVRLQRQPTMPVVRESKIIEEFRQGQRVGGGLQRSLSMNREIQPRQSPQHIQIAPQPTQNPHNTSQRYLIQQGSPQINQGRSQRPQIIIKIPQRTQSVEMRSQSPPPRPYPGLEQQIGRPQTHNQGISNAKIPNAIIPNGIYSHMPQNQGRVMTVQNKGQDNRQMLVNIQKSPSTNRKFNFAQQIQLMQASPRRPPMIPQHPPVNASMPPKPPRPTLVSQEMPRSHLHRQVKEAHMLNTTGPNRPQESAESRSRSKRRGIQRTNLLPPS